MKAIILAAGMGTRLGSFTNNLPKMLLGKIDLEMKRKDNNLEYTKIRMIITFQRSSD